MPKVRSHNRELARGINAYSRSVMLKKTGRYRFLKKGGEKKVAAAVVAKAPRYYNADDEKKPLSSRKKNAKPTKLRSSITPGTVLIVLSGRFRAKRVVFLKQLESGLLLVTGPYKVNGVPLRRLNQAYVIATSTSVSLDGVNVDAVTDASFARVETDDAEGEQEFFENKPKVVEISAERKANQKAVDDALLVNISKVPSLRSYLNAKFSLKRGQAPHMMQF